LVEQAVASGNPRLVTALARAARLDQDARGFVELDNDAAAHGRPPRRLIRLIGWWIVEEAPLLAPVLLMLGAIALDEWETRKAAP
jgi:hypothetical protein